MTLTRQTKSLCPTCYREVPALIEVKPDGAWMTKTCNAHGTTTALVERDPVFYTYIVGLKSSSIYPGYFVDVTRRCNLRCTYCYYALEPGKVESPTPEHLSIPAIVADCQANLHLAPFILTGGEPTLRDDLPDLIVALREIGPVELITNGVRIADDPHTYGLNIISALATCESSELHLSIHDKEGGAWRDVIERARERRIPLKSILMVVDSKESFLESFARAQALRDSAQCFRLKAASPIWSESKSSNIFVSDMIRWLEEAGHPVRIVTDRHNKSVIVSVICDGLFLMLVAWHNVHNVDLNDIECSPYYRARNGEIANMVTAMLINEGMSKGWMKGVNL